VASARESPTFTGTPCSAHVRSAQARARVARSAPPTVPISPTLPEDRPTSPSRTTPTQALAQNP
jgi:hypothetical protein